MIDYKKYSIADFVNNRSFRSWVLYDISGDKQFWENWIIENPEKSDIVAQAQFIVLSENDTQQQHISDAEVEHELVRLSETIPFELAHEPNIVPFYRQTWLRYAASLLLATGLGALLYFTGAGLLPQGLVSAMGMEDKAAANIITRTNTTAQQLLVTLPDGSSVLLHKNSTITFPDKFLTEKREVNLSGEAFFEVAKNPHQPFFIYTKDITTKVLGTSFTVKAFENEEQVKVIVKTGKVTITANQQGAGHSAQPLHKMVLTANQALTYHKTQQKMVFSGASKPADLAGFRIQKQVFDFKRMPVYNVLGVLSETYSVNIQADTLTMGNREITALLTDEPLFEKLSLICAAIDGYYEEKDGAIIIYGKKM